MFLPLHDDNPLRRLPIWTILIIVLNFGSLLLLLGANDHQRRVIVAKHGFVPQRFVQLWSNQAIQVDLYRGEPEVPRGVDRFLIIPASPLAVCLSLITCMFLHAGWMDLIGNMWFFVCLATTLRTALGGCCFRCCIY